MVNLTAEIKNPILAAFLAMSFIDINGQETDTLIYFDETDFMEPIIVIDDVSDLGVRFTPDSIWDCFDIISVDFLTPAPYPEQVPFQIYNANGENNYPGDIYDNFSVFFGNDSSATYPLWNNIDVSHYESMQNICGDFWVTGVANFGVLVVADTSSISGHTYAYFHAGYPCAPCWGNSPILDITIRAVIAMDDSLMTINHSNSLNNNSFNIIVNTYPNPFNSYQNISIEIPNQFLLLAPTVNIYNLLGEVVFREKISTGKHTYVWDGVDLNGGDVSSGIYLISVNVGHQVESKKIILLK